MSANAIQALGRGVELVESLLTEHPNKLGLYRHLAGFHRGNRYLHAVAGPRGNSADPGAAIVLVERATRIWEDFARDDSTEMGFQVDLAAFYFTAHEIQKVLGRPAEASARLRKSQAIYDRLARANPEIPEHRAELAWTHTFLAYGMLEDGQQEREEVEQHYRRSLDLRQKLVAEYPGVPEYRQALSVSHRDLGDWLLETGRLAEAERAYGEALAQRKQLVIEFPYHPGHRGDLAEYFDRLGNVFWLAGRLQSAEEAYRQAGALWEKLAAEFPAMSGYREKLASNLIELCILLAAAGRRQEAEQFYRKALEFKPESPDAQNRLAWLLAAHPDATLRDPGRAVELVKNATEQDPGRFEFWNTLGVAHYRAGNWNEAVAPLQKSMQLANGQYESFNTLFLAMACWRLGDKELAHKWYGQALQWMEKQQLYQAEYRNELRCFRAEAAELLGIKEPTGNKEENPHAKAPSP